MVGNPSLLVTIPLARWLLFRSLQVLLRVIEQVQAFLLVLSLISQAHKLWHISHLFQYAF